MNNVVDGRSLSLILKRPFLNKPQMKWPVLKKHVLSLSGEAELTLPFVLVRLSWLLWFWNTIIFMKLNKKMWRLTDCDALKLGWCFQFVILSRLRFPSEPHCCLPAWDAVGVPEEVESWVGLQWHGNGRYCIEATWVTGQPCFLQWYARSLQEGAPVLGAQSIPVHESYTDAPEVDLYTCMASRGARVPL